tara:strand:- start:1514 stop:3181 length:1668 start_codon:yes stop_codon:yes gene_type:complete
MSLTKIGSIGVSTGIQFAGVTTIATLNSSDNVLSVGGTVNFVSDVSIGGTVSIAGTLTYEDVTNVDAVGLITARNGVVVGSGITLSKDGDGFFTGVTTATTFVGALTGNVTGNISGGTIAGSTGTFTGDVDIADKIIHTGDTNTAIRFPAADTITAETGGSERIRIKSDGSLQVPIGSNIEIGQIASSSHADGNAGSVLLGIEDGGGAMSGVKVTNVDAGTYNDQIVTFLTAQGGVSTPTERLRITSGGEVGINCTPAGMFEVQKNGVPAIISNYNNSKHIGMSVGGSGGGFTQTTGNFFAFQHQPYADRGTDNNLTERLRIASDGKLSIDRTHASATTGNHPALDIDTYANGTAGASFATGIDFRVAGVHKKRLVVTNTDSSAGTGDWIFYRDQGNNVGLKISSAGHVTKPETPSFFATINGGDNTTNNGDTIPFNVVKHNNGSHFDTSTYKFVAPVSGFYYFFVQIWAKNSTTNARFHYRIEDASNSYAGNNITQNGFHANSVNNNDRATSASVVYQMDTGDRIFVQVDNTNLTYYTAGASDPHTYFCGYLIG